MDASVTRRVLHGLGANALGQLVTVIVQLAGVPILLHAWGPQLYGEWLILSAVPAYLAMTDLGFSQSAGNDMTARAARGDRSGALAVFQSLAVLVYSVAAVGLLLSGALLWGLPLERWLHFQALDAHAARWVLWLLAAQVFAALPNGVNDAGFRASGDYALHVGLDSTVRLFQFSGIWIAALLGGGPVAAAAVFFGIRVIATVALATLLCHRHRWLRFGMIHVRGDELRRLVAPAMANTAMPLAQSLNIQGMVLVVGAILGPLSVVVFSTLRTLTRLVIQIAMVISHAVEPEMAVAYGVDDRSLLRTLFENAFRSGFWSAMGSSLALALVGKFVLLFWTQGKVSMQSVLFAWLLASACSYVVWSNARILLQAANRHLRVAAWYIAVSILAVTVASALLFWTRQLAFAGLVLFVADVVMVIYSVHAAGQLINQRLSKCLKHAINPVPIYRSTRDAYAIFRHRFRARPGST